ncbi:hypothetical protein J6590_020307 [Homalodisca vitripennis]|nr:hypothetical protein J6590_020307 [Homalodisca vitripennis]
MTEMSPDVRNYYQTCWRKSLYPVRLEELDGVGCIDGDVSRCWRNWMEWDALTEMSPDVRNYYQTCWRKSLYPVRLDGNVCITDQWFWTRSRWYGGCVKFLCVETLFPCRHENENVVLPDYLVKIYFRERGGLRTR